LPEGASGDRLTRAVSLSFFESSEGISLLSKRGELFPRKGVNYLLPYGSWKLINISNSMLLYYVEIKVTYTYIRRLAPPGRDPEPRSLRRLEMIYVSIVMFQTKGLVSTLLRDIKSLSPSLGEPV
jgi:hypothetical protein